MTENSGTELEQRISELYSKDAVERERAREALVQMGHPAVSRLGELLGTEEPQHVRWEAGKALAAICDPAAVPQLLVALGDEDADVRWVTGQALIAIGEPTVKPLFKTLATANVPDGFYRAAHHVLHDLALQSGSLSKRLKPVLTAFAGPEPRLSVPVAAEQALRQGDV